MRVTEVAVADGEPPVLLAVEPAGTRDPDDDWAELSGPERAATAAMDAVRAEEFVRGRSLLRRLAGSVLGLPGPRVPLALEPGGRPYLEGLAAGVSLSHTEGCTAAAVRPCGAVGVDVQRPPESVDDRLVRRCCGVWAERVLSLPGPARAAAFARVWAVQEACVKSLGQGIFAEPWRIAVPPGAGGGRWGEVSWRSLPEVASAALAVAAPRLISPVPHTPAGVDDVCP
ncbi:4'-phosphopantetheinyl transferase superfamily protein [Streptomyces sp. NPDC013455]|uniref:4'-phosphopantetheinyl transferase family protein n=1 Tax=Streptomyces sp. NPDC013455 TaxID=3155605 RepID=UPI0033FA33EC